MRKVRKEENDPDTLQLRDETDKQWVKLWRKASTKDSRTADNTTFIVEPMKKKQQHV